MGNFSRMVPRKFPHRYPLLGSAPQGDPHNKKAEQAEQAIPCGWALGGVSWDS